MCDKNKRKFSLLKEAVMTFRLVELKKCYKLFGEPIKNSRKAEMQKKVLLYLDGFKSSREDVPLLICSKIFEMERYLKNKVDKRKRRKKVPKVTSNRRTIIPSTDYPKSPFFEIVEVLETATTNFQVILNVRIPNRYLPNLRKKKHGLFAYEIQLLFLNDKNEQCEQQAILYQVNNFAEQESLKSPPIIYIAPYCVFNKKAVNRIKVKFPSTETEIKVMVSIVKRLTPIDLVSMRPVAKVNRTEELLRKKLTEENLPAYAIFLISPEEHATIQNPCRSSFCSHPEVFDLLYFLNKMQYYLTWSCPLCVKRVSYESLELETQPSFHQHLGSDVRILDMILSQNRFFHNYIDSGKVTFNFHKKREIKIATEIKISEELILLD